MCVIEDYIIYFDKYEKVVVKSKLKKGVMFSVSFKDWKPSRLWHLNNCSWNENSVVAVQEKVQGDNIRVKIMNFGSFKDWWMQMLLYFNEDFDDDLLLEAIRLLPDEKS